jgi:hypothetical protein
MINNEMNRKEIERKEQNNLLARVLECFDGFRVECWICNSDGFGNGQFIRTKAYKTLTGARKYASQFVGAQG